MRYRRMMTAIVALMAIFCSATAQSLTVQDIEAQAGEQATLVVSLSGATAMTALQFNLSLPDGVTLVGGGTGITLGSATNGHTLSLETLDSGDRMFAIYSMNLNTFGDGVLLHIPVTVGSNARSGTGCLYTVRMATAGAVSQTCSAASFAVTVGGDDVTLRAKSYTREYGEENPTFEYEVSDGAITSGTPTITCSATKTSPVGTYDIVISKGTVSNSTVNLVNGTLTINPKNASSLTIGPIADVVYNGSAQTPAVTVKDGTNTLTAGTDYTVAYSNNVNAGTATATVTTKGNYTGTKTASFTVTKAPLTVTAKSYTITYGSALPTFAATYTGFKNGETASVLTTQPTFSCPASSSSGPGEYDITVGGAEAQNYEMTYVKGKLTINLRNVSSLTIGSIAAVVYNGSEQTPAVTVKDGTTTLTSGTDYTVAYSNNVNAGVATVTITGKGNYTGTKTATFAITKATLTVSAGDYTKMEGEENPPFTPTFSGFINGETESVLTKQPTVTTTATTNSPAGTYPVTVSGAEAQNYRFNYVNGTLTVTVNPDRPVVGMTFEAPVPCGNGTVNLTFKVTSLAPMEVKLSASPQNVSGALTIPATVTKASGEEFTVKRIADHVFKDCSGLTTVTIGNSVESIGFSAFEGCSGLTSVTIPASVTSIYGSAFLDCSSLKGVHSMIEVPFGISDNTFKANGVWTTATLYVPEGTEAKYKATAGWKNFKKIVQIANTTTDISDSERMGENENVNEVYDLNGRRMSMLVKGINIVRQSDGRVKKVVR